MVAPKEEFLCEMITKQKYLGLILGTWEHY